MSHAVDVKVHTSAVVLAIVGGVPAVVLVVNQVDPKMKC